MNLYYKILLYLCLLMSAVSFAVSIVILRAVLMLVLSRNVLDVVVF